MIFLLRVVIFSALIIGGFAISVKSITSRKIITVIYTLTLLWYTFLCRLPLFTSVPAAADDGSSAPASPSLAEQIWRGVVAIFGSQSDGTLAGSGVAKGIVMNALLFVPCGSLLLLWIPALREKRKGRIVAILICMGISIIIELLQEITGLGMADWKDVLGNSMGAAVGVGMVIVWERHRAAARMDAHNKK